MKNEPVLKYIETGISPQREWTKFIHSLQTVISEESDDVPVNEGYNDLPEILIVSSYPPRECGLATYSQDLIKALNDKFENSFSIKVCALQSGNEKYEYPEKVQFVMDTRTPKSYYDLANAINNNDRIQLVMIQHEFGLFENHESDLLQFINRLVKPVIMVFHTVLPHPNKSLKRNVQHLISGCESVIVMTNNAARLLTGSYQAPEEKISVIPHGTHLVPHLDKRFLKKKYGLNKKMVLSTFGLISSGKSIETTLNALPAILEKHPDVIFLVIGKTHPSVLKREGEAYRHSLESKINELGLQQHVRFINQYLPLPDLLEYLQLTDIYLFTSRDPNQAVSGSFSYAASCGCAIISTPIPHASEVLDENAGIIIDFENSPQLASAVNRLLSDEPLRKSISLNGYQKIVSSAWENSAVAHAALFEKMIGDKMTLKYSLPDINLDHIKKLTTDFGIIQFSKINQPDIQSGYTLDDNARALIALCQHYELTGDKNDLMYINTYFDFITYCFQPEGYFLNYVDWQEQFTEQNNTSNLADANGRVIWALGYLISRSALFPGRLIEKAELIMRQVLIRAHTIYSTRAMAFVIKGLCYYNSEKKSAENFFQIKLFADRLVQMYNHESGKGWEWFESYLTYANSILPEAMLCAYLETGNLHYKKIAQASFAFLLSCTFNGDRIKVVSNKSWLHKGEKAEEYGEQPIDVAYTVIALARFYEVFKEKEYLRKMREAFSWFLGNNHLNQIVYNPCTGGCHDGLEESNVNLNQGAESTVSYLIARLTVEKFFGNPGKLKPLLKSDWKPNVRGQLV